MSEIIKGECGGLGRIPYLGGMPKYVLFPKINLTFARSGCPNPLIPLFPVNNVSPSTPRLVPKCPILEDLGAYAQTSCDLSNS